MPASRVPGTRSPFNLFLLTLALAACTSDPTTRAPVVRDSAGIRIVENPDTTPGELPVWRVAEARVSIGEADSPDDAYLLAAVGGALRLGDGRIVVAEGRPPRLRVYDAMGRHLEDWGRQGNGPGEFAYPIWHLSRYRGDSLLVGEIGARRLTILDSAGRFGRLIVPQPTFRRGENQIPTQSCCWLAGSLPDGAFVFVYPGLASTLGSGARRAAVTVTRLSAEGTAWDTVGTFASEDWVDPPIGFTYPDGRRPDVVQVQFGTRLVVTTGRGRIWLGTGEDHTVQVLSGDGDTLSLIRWAARRVPFTAGHKDDYLEVMRSLSGENPETYSGALVERLASMPFPDSLPSAFRYVVDRTGRLWAEDVWLHFRPQEPTRFTVFDSTGVVLARAVLPIGFFTVMDAGEDWVLGLDRDSLEVQRVKLFDLVR